MGGGAGPMLFPGTPLVGDLCALALSTCYAVLLLRFFEETASRGVFEQVFFLNIARSILGLFEKCNPVYKWQRVGFCVLLGIHIPKPIWF